METATTRPDPAHDLPLLVELEALRLLKARYCRYVDQKRWDELRTLFTDDCRFVIPPRAAVASDAADGVAPALPRMIDSEVIEGADPFMAFLKNRMTRAVTVHHCHTPELELTGPDSARGVWAMEDYVEHPSEGARVGIRGYGHYIEDYRKQDGRWRISDWNLIRLRLDPL